MRRFLAELHNRLAITWDEYSTAHPRTKKTPDDPMFTQPGNQPKKPAAPDKKPVQKAPSQQKPSAPKTKPSKPSPKKKPLAEMTDDELIDKYTPKFSTPSKNQRDFSPREIKEMFVYGDGSDHDRMKPEVLATWTADDFAWQMCKGKNWKFFEEHSYDHISGPGVGFLQIQNPNVPKRSKDDTAAWLIDKAGVSFVAGPSLNKYLQACARKGLISAKILKAAEDDDTRDQLFYNGLTDPDEIRKFDVKKWDYQILNNRSTPADVLMKILKMPQYQKGLSIMKTEGIFNISSSTGPYEHERMSAVNNAEKVISHQNFPLEELLKIPTMKPSNKQARGILLDRADLPEPLRTQTFNALLKSKPERGYSSSIIFPEFPLSKEEFTALWNKYKKDHAAEVKSKDQNGYATSLEYKLEDILDHKSCPDEVLKEILEWPLRQDFDDQVTPRGKRIRVPSDRVIDSIAKARGKAYKKCIEKGFLKEADIIKAVGKNLNLHGDPDLLVRIGEAAFTSFPLKESTKRTFKKVSPQEMQKIKEYMAQTNFHDDFDYDVVGVWEVDKEPHKDFAATSKKIGNVKTGLYHGTTFASAGGILTDGVKLGKERTGAMFGEGFYLASASSKAAQYASDKFSHEEGEGIVLMLDAALGQTTEMKYGRPGRDEMKYTMQDEAGEKLRQEYKKKTGKNLTSKWHANYDSVTAKAGMALDYDEYVVKDPSQIQVKRIIHIRKKPKGKKN